MVCAQVMGNNTAISVAGASGAFEVRPLNPLNRRALDLTDNSSTYSNPC
jgi:fumarate hydratase class II